jgi:hypothetical protein
MQAAPSAATLRDEFDALESEWEPPEATGFEPVRAA